MCVLCSCIVKGMCKVGCRGWEPGVKDRCIEEMLEKRQVLWCSQGLFVGADCVGRLLFVIGVVVQGALGLKKKT